MLERAGLNVTVASNGRIALDLWRAQAFDLVLMDCQMPEPDGFQTAMQMRAEEACSTRRTHIVARTANAMQGDRGRCIAADMDDYPPKPFRRAELMNVLSLWLDRTPRETVEPASAMGPFSGRLPD